MSASGKLYFATEKCRRFGGEDGEKYEVLATNKIANEMFVSTPAIAAGSLYLRSDKNLYCIREERK